jgi:outer membrane autotransporter protein
MKKLFLIPPIGLALAALSSAALAREVVVLPGVVGPVGVASGVDTQGPGTLTVGNQDINTGNSPGGAITSSAANTASIAFNGSSTVTGFVGSTGTTFLRVAAGANGSTVNFNGPVFATTFSLSGTGVVNFNGGFTSNTGSTMDFAGDGFINVAAGQTVKAALTNTAGANTGTLTLNSGSIFDGAVGAGSGLKVINVVGGNALITGQARAGTYNLGTNTLNVAGALAIPVAGVINTTIFSPSLYGKITPVGAATIGNALQVNVTVTGPIANGSSFNIVDATSGTSGSTVTATSNTTRYAFSAAPTTAGLVRITTTQIPLADVVAPVVAPPTVTPVTTPTAPILPPSVNPTLPLTVAPVIDALPLTPVTGPVLTAITLLPNAAAVAQALAQLGPGTANLAAPQVGYRMAQRFQDVLASHLEAQEACNQDSRGKDRNRGSLDASSICQTSGSHFWVSGFGYDRAPFSIAKQGDVNGFEGYDARIAGAMVAYDAPVNDATVVGGGLRFAKSNINGNASGNFGSAFNSQSDITSYQATVYVGYAPGPIYLNGALTYGYDRYSGLRHVVFPGVNSTVFADYNGHQLTASAMTGYHIYLGDSRTVVTPYASLQYTALQAGSYTETGDPGLNLKVNAQRYDFLESGLGLTVARDIALAGAQALRPEIHAKWLHAMGDSTMSNTATFVSGGPAFTTLGLKPDPNTFNLGAGVTFGHVGRWSMQGAYDYLWRARNYSAQQMTLSFVLHI